MSKKIAIHIGINNVDNDKYGAEIPPLFACENDAIELEKLTSESGFETQLLLSQEATTTNIINQIKSVAKSLVKDDKLLLTYSGHGSQIRDRNGDESDNLDECWIAYDKPFLDDELSNLWTLFDEGVEILLISDSCHSGTISRSKSKRIVRRRSVPKSILDESIDKRKYTGFKKKVKSLEAKSSEIKAGVILLAACQDYQVAFEGENHGLFTESILKVYSRNKKAKRAKRFTPRFLIEESKKILGQRQSPNYYKIGNISRSFLYSDIFL